MEFLYVILERRVGILYEFVYECSYNKLLSTEIGVFHDMQNYLIFNRCKLLELLLIVSIVYYLYIFIYIVLFVVGRGGGSWNTLNEICNVSFVTDI